MEFFTYDRNREKLIIDRENERKQVAKQKLDRDSKWIEVLISMDAVDALEIFPRELWELILKRVNVPTDLYHASKACTLFQNILKLNENYIGDVLLPQILQVESFWTLLRSDEEMKILREVCKSVRDAVDTLTELRLQKYRIKLGERSDPSPNAVSMDGPELYGSRYRSCQFLHKALFINFSNGGPQMFMNFPYFIPSVIQTMRSVSYFHFHSKPADWEPYNCNIIALYMNLRGCVSQMPNLKTLRIDICYREFKCSCNSCQSWYDSPRGSNLLRNMIEADESFPVVNSLDTLVFNLSLRAGRKDQETILKAILNKNPHVKCLTVDKLYHGLQYHRDPPSEEPVDDNWEEWQEDHPYTGFGLDMRREYPITELMLKIEGKMKTDVHKLFRSLEKYPTLETVNLIFTYFVGSDDPDTLHLPNVTSFSFYFEKEANSLKFLENIDFLWPMKTLKHLIWIGKNIGCSEMLRPENWGQENSFISIENIFEVFPSLTSAQVRRSSVINQ